MSESGFTWGDYISWRERARDAEKRVEAAEAEVARLREGLRETADELASRRGMIDRLVAADKYRALLAEDDVA